MREKQLVLCVAHIDGNVNHCHLEKRIIYHGVVPTIKGSGDFIRTMGRKLPINRTATFQTPYYEVNAKTIRRL